MKKVPKADGASAQPNKRVTICDLARELGLSHRAVSQALNPRPSTVKLNPATAARIQALAAERNYLRDSRARSMRTGRFYNIGYFEAKAKARGLPLLGAESGVCDEANEHDYHVVLVQLPSDMASKPGSLPFIFRESNLDALIISHAGNLTAELEKVIDASGFPVVYLNEKKSHNAVYVDDLRGGEEITRHLFSAGNREIAFVSFRAESSHYSAKDRLRGYNKAMIKAGLVPICLNLSENRPAEFFSWLSTHKNLEAIVAGDDHCAIRILHLLYPTPWKVPAKLALTGFGDDFAEDFSPVDLTTMRIPFYEMGKAAVKMALELVNGKHSRIPSQIFPEELVVRESTRCRKSGR